MGGRERSKQTGAYAPLSRIPKSKAESLCDISELDPEWSARALLDLVDGICLFPHSGPVAVVRGELVHPSGAPRPWENEESPFFDEKSSRGNI